MKEEPRLFELPPPQNTKKPGGLGYEGELKRAAARNFHPWTGHKLDLYELYLKQYRRIASGTYIDGFAGSGRALINGEERHGSALIAAKAGVFKRLFLFETDSTHRASLHHNIGYYCRRNEIAKCVIEDDDELVDCNVGIPALLASGRVPTDKPCFAFLDPNSTQLAWATVADLAAHRPLDLTEGKEQYKVELWILLNTSQALSRMWPRRKQRDDLPGSEEKLDQMFGGRPAWIDLWTNGDTMISLLGSYCDRLRRDLGYRYVNPISIKGGEGRQTIYYMIHATDHPSGKSNMQWADGAVLPTRKLIPDSDFQVLDPGPPGCES